jgi:vacuolar iron transporter family protein
MPPYPPANSGPAYGRPLANSGPMPAYQANGAAPARGYPQANGRPVNGRPPVGSGPMAAYRAGGAPPRGYPPPNGRPVNGRPPASSGPMPSYRPSMMPPYPADRSPMAGYRAGGAPARGYPPPNGRPVNGRPLAESGPMPAYQYQADTMVAIEHDMTTGYQPDAAEAGAAGAMLMAYLANSGPMSAYQPRGGRSAPGKPQPPGKQIMGWLPFGNRLVLLPRDLDDTDEELREHRDVNGGWLRPAVFGAMDGLVTNSSLIAGIGGGGGGHGMIVLTGIAGLIAGAFSMATGEFISVKSQNELTLAEVELERKQHARDPAGKQRRLTEVYVEKGVSPNLAEAVVRQISADPDRAVETHVREELGIDPDDLPSPQTAAVASFASFTVGALLPLSPFLLGIPSLKVALTVAGLSALVGGAAVAKLTGRSMLLGGLRQFTAAFLGTGAAFLMGHLLGGHVG